LEGHMLRRIQGNQGGLYGVKNLKGGGPPAARTGIRVGLTGVFYGSARRQMRGTAYKTCYGFLSSPSRGKTVEIEYDGVDQREKEKR